MLTFATFASFPNSLDNADFTIATASDGSLTANTYYFWIQLHNWAGRNTQTSLNSITVSNGQKIVITLKPTLRRNGEDFNFVIISANSTDNPNTAIQIARWENKEEEIHPTNSKVALATDTLVAFSTDKIIEITHDSQLTFSLPSLTVANFASLPSSNLLNGAVRYVTADAKYYRYKANTAQWVEQLNYGVFPYISDSKLEGGCDRKLNILTNTVPAKLKSNQDSIYQTFWFINGYSDDGNGEIKATNNISLAISVNGELTNSQNISYASLFSGLIKTRLLGFYDFSDRSLDDSLPGVGDTNTWTWENSTLKLPIDLPRGQAAVYEIYFSFSTADLVSLIPQGSTISLNIYNYGIKSQPTDLSYLTGDFIVNTGDKLRLVPDTVGVKRLNGVSIIKNFSSNFTSEENYNLGILLDTNNQIAAISASKVNEIRFIQDENDLQATEVIRAFIGTVNGESALSNVSNTIAVSDDARIDVTIDLPSDGTNATIRSNYPDPAIAGNNKAILNAPKLTLYLSNGTTVYKHENVVNCGNVDSLNFSINTLGTEVFTLPSPPNSDYCLFGFPNNPVISESVGLGSIPSGSYQVYLAYSYPSPNVFPTRIRHDLTGCISESANSLIELNSFFDNWILPNTDSDIVYQNGQYKGIKHNLTAIADPDNTNDITEGYVVKSFWVNTDTNRFFVCVDNSENNAVWSSGGGDSTLETLNSNRNYYISTTGNDGNDGLTAGNPIKTFQHFFDNIAPNIDLNGYDLILNVADGTYDTEQYIEINEEIINSFKQFRTTSGSKIIIQANPHNNWQTESNVTIESCWIINTQTTNYIIEIKNITLKIRDWTIFDVQNNNINLNFRQCIFQFLTNTVNNYDVGIYVEFYYQNVRIFINQCSIKNNLDAFIYYYSQWTNDFNGYVRFNALHFIDCNIYYTFIGASNCRIQFPLFGAPTGTYTLHDICVEAFENVSISGQIFGNVNFDFDSQSQTLYKLTNQHPVGFFGTTPISKQTLPNSYTLTDLVAILVDYGLIDVES